MINLYNIASFATEIVRPKSLCSVFKQTNQILDDGTTTKAYELIGSFDCLVHSMPQETADYFGVNDSAYGRIIFMESKFDITDAIPHKGGAGSVFVFKIRTLGARDNVYLKALGKISDWDGHYIKYAAAVQPGIVIP